MRQIVENSIWAKALVEMIGTQLDLRQLEYTG